MPLFPQWARARALLPGRGVARASCSVSASPATPPLPRARSPSLPPLRAQEPLAFFLLLADAMKLPNSLIPPECAPGSPEQDRFATALARVVSAAVSSCTRSTASAQGRSLSPGASQASATVLAPLPPAHQLRGRQRRLLVQALALAVDRGLRAVEQASAEGLPLSPRGPTPPGGVPMHAVPAFAPPATQRSSVAAVAGLSQPALFDVVVCLHAEAACAALNCACLERVAGVPARASDWLAMWSAAPPPVRPGALTKQGLERAGWAAAAALAGLSPEASAAMASEDPHAGAAASLALLRLPGLLLSTGLHGLAVRCCEALLACEGRLPALSEAAGGVVDDTTDGVVRRLHSAAQAAVARTAARGGAEPTRQGRADSGASGSSELADLDKAARSAKPLATELREELATLRASGALPASTEAVVLVVTGSAPQPAGGAGGPPGHALPAFGAGGRRTSRAGSDRSAAAAAAAAAPPSGAADSARSPDDLVASWVLDAARHSSLVPWPALSRVFAPLRLSLGSDAAAVAEGCGGRTSAAMADAMVCAALLRALTASVPRAPPPPAPLAPILVGSSGAWAREALDLLLGAMPAALPRPFARQPSLDAATGSPGIRARDVFAGAAEAAGRLRASGAGWLAAPVAAAAAASICRRDGTPRPAAAAWLCAAAPAVFAGKQSAPSSREARSAIGACIASLAVSRARQAAASAAAAAGALRAACVGLPGRPDILRLLGLVLSLQAASLAAFGGAQGRANAAEGGVRPEAASAAAAAEALRCLDDADRLQGGSHGLGLAAAGAAMVALPPSWCTSPPTPTAGDAALRAAASADDAAPRARTVPAAVVRMLAAFAVATAGTGKRAGSAMGSAVAGAAGAERALGVACEALSELQSAAHARADAPVAAAAAFADGWSTAAGVTPAARALAARLRLSACLGFGGAAVAPLTVPGGGAAAGWSASVSVAEHASAGAASAAAEAARAAMDAACARDALLPALVAAEAAATASWASLFLMRPEAAAKAPAKALEAASAPPSPRAPVDEVPLRIPPPALPGAAGGAGPSPRSPAEARKRLLRAAVEAHDSLRAAGLAAASQLLVAAAGRCRAGDRAAVARAAGSALSRQPWSAPIALAAAIAAHRVTAMADAEAAPCAAAGPLSASPGAQGGSPPDGAGKPRPPPPIRATAPSGGSSPVAAPPTGEGRLPQSGGLDSAEAMAAARAGGVGAGGAGQRESATSPPRGASARKQEQLRRPCAAQPSALSLASALCEAAEVQERGARGVPGRLVRVAEAAGAGAASDAQRGVAAVAAELWAAAAVAAARAGAGAEARAALARAEALAANALAPDKAAAGPTVSAAAAAAGLGLCAPLPDPSTSWTTSWRVGVALAGPLAILTGGTSVDGDAAKASEEEDEDEDARARARALAMGQGEPSPTLASAAAGEAGMGASRRGGGAGPAARAGAALFTEGTARLPPQAPSHLAPGGAGRSGAWLRSVLLSAGARIALAVRQQETASALALQAAAACDGNDDAAAAAGEALVAALGPRLQHRDVSADESLAVATEARARLEGSLRGCAAAPGAWEALARLEAACSDEAASRRCADSAADARAADPLYWADGVHRSALLRVLAGEATGCV